MCLKSYWIFKKKIQHGFSFLHSFIWRLSGASFHSFTLWLSCIMPVACLFSFSHNDYRTRLFAPSLLHMMIIRHGSSLLHIMTIRQGSSLLHSFIQWSPNTALFFIAASLLPPKVFICPSEFGISHLECTQEFSPVQISVYHLLNNYHYCSKTASS